MRFLADQDVWALTLQVLRDWGHDVVAASALGLARARDFTLLQEATERNRLFVT